MQIPFTIEQFLEVMANYNISVWPMQIILNLLALVAIVLSFKKINAGDKINSAILSFFWLWIGVMYHLIHFTSINNAAYLFGMLFIIQGIIFIYAGIIKPNLSFKFELNWYAWVGALFILYALLIYPLLGYLFGHVYPKSPTFGLPCPTTIFTFGLLLWTNKRVPKYVIIIPFIWALIGTGAAVNLTIYEDYGLFLAGVLGLIFIIIRDRKLYNIKQ